MIPHRMTEKDKRMTIKRNELYIMHGQAYTEMTRELLRRCGLADLIPSRNALIGIKPNLLAPIRADEGATTHPEVTEGVLIYLREEGFENVVILESSWVGDRTEISFEYCGYEQLSRKYRAPLWDLQEDPGVDVEARGMTLKVCKRALDIDFLINLPVIKGHCQTKMTGALKNLKGLLPAGEKRRFHRMGLHEPIAHLCAALNQGFILADCICPDLSFEDGGNPVQLDRLIAALDPVLLDTYGCRLVGVAPEEVPYIGLASGLGAGSCDPDEARITHMHQSFEKGCAVYRTDPGQAWDEESCSGAGGYRTVMKLAENVHEIESCSACYAGLIPALRRLEEEGLLQDLTKKICIGQGYRGKDGELGVGNCTSRFRHSLKGCPPTQEEIYDYLKAYCRSCTI